MNQTEHQTLAQYRIFPQVEISHLLSVSESIVTTLRAPSSTCIITCSEIQHAGSIEEMRNHLSAIQQHEIIEFTLNVGFTFTSEYIQQQTQQLQPQIQSLQVQIQQSSQAALRAQRAQLQQQFQQKNQELQNLHSAQTLISLNVNFATEILTLSTTLPISTFKSATQVSLEPAISLLQDQIPKQNTSDSRIADLDRRLNKMMSESSSLEEQLQRVRQITGQGIALLPSIQDTLERATQSRASVEATELDVTRLRTTTEHERNKLGELYEDLRQKRAELSQLLEVFSRNLALGEKKLDDANARIQATFASAVSRDELSIKNLEDAKAEAQNFESYIKTIRDELEGNVKNITSQSEEDLSIWKISLDTALAQCNDKRDKIHQLLGASVAANLSAAFLERQKDLEKGRGNWLTAIIITTISLTATSYFVLVNGHDSSIAIWIQRVFTILPLVLLDIFFLGQYNRKMLLADQYAFKATVAASFDYYKEELQRNSKDNSPLADFVAQTVGRLWTEPSLTTELNGTQIRRIVRMIETLGVKAISEGSTVAQAVVNKKQLPSEPTGTQSATETQPNSGA